VKPVLPFLLVQLVCPALATEGEMPPRSEPTAAVRADWLSRATDLEKQRDWPALLGWGLYWARAEPGNATAWFVMGRANSEMKRYPEAIKAYRQNLEIDPGDFFALNNLGNAYRDSKQFPAAITAYREAVLRNPDFILAWQNLGLTFYTLNGVAGVTRALQQLSASDPALAEAWRHLAIEYSLSRDQRVAQKAVGVLRRLDAEQRRQMFKILFGNV